MSFFLHFASSITEIKQKSTILTETQKVISVGKFKSKPSYLKSSYLKPSYLKSKPHIKLELQRPLFLTYFQDV